MVTGMAHGDFAQSAARTPSGQVSRHGSDPFRQPIAKIISGGQTGADRGAIEAALKAGFAYGGLVPKGRLAEDGCVPTKFIAMDEADTEDYRFRTRWNAEHSGTDKESS